VKLDKGDFIGREVLEKQKLDGTTRKIVGFEMVDRGVARAGYSVTQADHEIGTVTTGSYAPSLDKNLGLALIQSDHAKLGQAIAIQIRGKSVFAQIMTKPFYKREGK